MEEVDGSAASRMVVAAVPVQALPQACPLLPEDDV
jgi:hypothetical protein